MIIIVCVYRKDRTVKGHILGAAEERQPEAYPQRSLLPLDCAIVRLFTHMAMYLGATVNLEVFKTALKNNIKMLFYYFDKLFYKKNEVEHANFKMFL